MAIDHRKISKMEEREHSKKTSITLRDEEKSVRIASSRLAIDDRENSYDTAHLENIIIKQQKEQEQLVQQLKEMLQELQTLNDAISDVSHTAQQMALKGATKAQADAEELTKKRLEKVTKENIKQIESLVKESQERIKKLKKTTLIERFNPIAIWITLVMILCMLSYHICLGS